MLNFFIHSHSESASSFILFRRKQNRLIFMCTASLVALLSLYCCFWTMCLVQSFIVPIKRPLPVLWSAKSATYCTKVHQSAPHHCPPQPIRRPLKHIKSPAGDHETASRFTPVSSTSIPTSPTPTLPSVYEARFKKREREGGVDPPFGWIEIIFHSWKPCQEILCLKNKSSPHFTNGQGKHII